jgi:WD40 repeat protein
MRYFMTTSVNDKISLFLSSIIILTIGYIFYADRTGQFEKHKSWVYSVDNNKQDIVVSASENELLLWNKRKCTDRLVGHTDAIKTVAFSHSGQQIASGSIDKSIKVWSTTNKKAIKTLNGHKEGVNKVEFSNTDTYIVSAGYDDKMFIWDWTNNKVIKELNIKHTNFSINNHDILAYIDSSCVLTLFDLKSLSEIKAIGHFCGSPVFNPQKNIIAVKDSIFTFIDLNSKTIISTLNIKKENSVCEVSTFKFTPDGQYLVAAIWGDDIEIWDWQKKQLLRTLQGHNLNSVDDLSFDITNQLISASGDRSLKFWDLNTGNLKMVVGDGLFQSKLYGLLSISILLTLIAGFWALTKNIENKISTYILLSILTVWSLGFGLVSYFFKTTLSKFAIPIIWTTSIFSGLFFLSVYGSWLTIFTIPVSLLFCFIKMTTSNDRTKIYFPLIINLVFCGILCSFVTSAGLWK